MSRQTTVAQVEVRGDGWTADQTQAAAKLFNQHGYLLLKNAFSRALVNRWSKSYQRQYECLSEDQLARSHAMVGDQRYMITIEIAPPFSSPQLYAQEQITRLLQQLLGTDMMISSFGSVLSLPGATDQAVHFDFPPLFESAELCASLPAYAITLAVPLIDLTEQTGTTAVWGGSHGNPTARSQLRQLAAADTLRGATPLYACRGDAFLMDFRLIHAGTANRSDQPRPLLYIVYCRSWFRDGKNFTEQPAIRISRSQLLKVPRRHRHLFTAAMP